MVEIWSPDIRPMPFRDQELVEREFNLTRENSWQESSEDPAHFEPERPPLTSPPYSVQYGEPRVRKKSAAAVKASPPRKPRMRLRRSPQKSRVRPAMSISETRSGKPTPA